MFGSPLMNVEYALSAGLELPSIDAGCTNWLIQLGEVFTVVYSGR